MINSEKLDYNAMKIGFANGNSANKSIEYQLYSQNRNLIESNDRKNHIKSICSILEKSKLDIHDVKILSQVVLNAVIKMSSNDDYSKSKDSSKIYAMTNLRNEKNCKEDYIKSIFTFLESSKLETYNIQELDKVMLKAVKKVTGENDSNCSQNISGYKSRGSAVSTPNNNNKEYCNNGYDADISNENSSTIRTSDEYFMSSNILSTNYLSKHQEYSNISSILSSNRLSSNQENTNKMSSSGVFTESISEDSDCSDVDIVTRIIEDSNDESLSDSCSTDCYTDDVFVGGNSHQLHGNNSTLCNDSFSTSINSDSLNRSTSTWLANYSASCDCDSCLHKQVKEELDYFSISSSLETEEIDSLSNSVKRALHCAEDNLCLLCIQQKKRDQTNQNSFLF